MRTGLGSHLVCEQRQKPEKETPMNEQDVGIQQLSDEEEQQRIDLLKRISELDQQIEDYCCGGGCSIGNSTT